MVKAQKKLWQKGSTNKGERESSERPVRDMTFWPEYCRDIILFVRWDDARIIEVNEAAIRAYGYTRDELLQKPFNAGELTAKLHELLSAKQKGI